MTGSIHVDSHSHIFNAEDLPIDGFVKTLSPVPRLLTAVVSVPLDRLTSWAAPGTGEADRLLDLLRGASGFEGLGTDVEDVSTELVSEEELDQLLVRHLGSGPGIPRLESPGMTVEDEIAAKLETLSIDEVVEVESWLRDWGDPDLEQELSDTGAQLEGLRDMWSWANSRATALHHATKRYVAALNLITSFRYEIAADLAQTYSEVSLFTPALVDFSYTVKDRPATRVPAQIAIHSLVSKLSIKGALPGAPDARIHPFVGYCPYREIENSELKFWNVNTGERNFYVPYADPATAQPHDRYRPGLVFDPRRAKELSVPNGPWHAAKLEIDHVERSLDLVRHAIELGGFTGIKLYPPSGFLPLGNVARFGERKGQQLDAALRSLYSYCVTMDVPILTHAAASNGFEDGYNDLASPAGWELALREFPKLRVCFGHFGHLQGESGNPPAGEDSFGWPSRFIRLIDQFPHVYADVGNSKFAISKDYRTKYLSVLNGLLRIGKEDAASVKRRKRLMFGTDYWMNTLSPDHRGYYTVFNKAMNGHFGSQISQWFMGDNALRFLGVMDDRNGVDITNANRQRLISFYDSNDLPAWLT